MLFVTGLGLNPALLQTTAGITALKSGTVAINPSAAPGYSIKQHTLYQVWREQMPPDFGWFSEMGVTPLTRTGGTNDPAVSAARADAWRARLRAATATLPECPPGAVTDNGASCYYGRAAMGAYQEMADGSIQLMAPGTFHIYGVTFAVTDLKNGVFLKWVKPDATTRKRIEWAVIKRSIGRFFGDKAGRYNGAPPVIGDGMIKSALNVSNPSVDNVMKAVPDIALYWVNFDRNPIQPTPTERTQPGGWASWIRRGGFPLSRAVLEGKVSLYDSAFGIEFCSSILCRCPTTQGKEPGTGRTVTQGGLPSCVPMGFTKNGVGREEGSGSFFAFVKITETIGDPMVELKLVHNDPSWIAKIGMAGRDWMMKIVDTACSNESINTNPQAKLMCAAWGVGKVLQAKETLPDASTLPAPEAPIIPQGSDALPLPVAPTPSQPSTVGHYTGCVSRFHKTKKTFSVYCPTNWRPPASGFGAVDLFGQTVTPAPPTGTIKVVDLPAAPSEAIIIGTEDDPFYKKPLFWVAVVGGAAVVVGGGYVIYRRKRAA
jgi:hypothetical protein